MPITPLHMGPGICIKALLQGSFSLMVFGWSQIVMDMQPLIVLVTGQGHLHGFSHTYIGALLLAIIAALSGKYLSEIGLKTLGILEKDGQAINISWLVVFGSAFIGTITHVFLDSIMHTDIEPFYPFTNSNNLLGIIGIYQLEKLCLYSGGIGAVIYYLSRFFMLRK
ncbi:MAG: metal-dependent hydrolase [Mariprofundales bacterium]